MLCELKPCLSRSSSRRLTLLHVREAQATEEVNGAVARGALGVVHVPASGDVLRHDTLPVAVFNRRTRASPEHRCE